ncbi:MAG: terminase [Ruminococcaceae bacterium]|nr:terminase [Oscillospiraceae bacterium]
MAKDGTARGGARPGSGPKRKPLTEKIAKGKTAQVIELPDTPDLEGADMPPVNDYMKAHQKNGIDLCAEEIFTETWDWLKKIGCTEYVNVQLINQYDMSVARQIQCEQCISEYGFLAKHPTTGNAIASPYVSMLQQFTKQVNQAWYQIYQIVRENCSVEFQGTPQDDVMERLLRTRKGN